MKSKKVLIFLFVLTFAFCTLFGVAACTDTRNPDNSGGDNIEKPGGDNTEVPNTQNVDVFLFIGQSNMAGRGDSLSATEVEEGHAYEFRAISDPTKLYPLTEPFGVNENNSESGVTENKKTGSLVSAFCESYYSVTKTPIVAVSCSKGGERISFFDTDTAVYRDAVARVTAAQNWLNDEEQKEFKLRNTYVVWLQGESDGDAGTSSDDYTAALGRIADGFKQDVDSQQMFVIPIGGYNGADYSKKVKYNTIRTSQISYAENNADISVISTTLFDLYTYGYMKDTFHYTQEGYEIVGKDAGANAAYFVVKGEKPECKAFFKEEEKIKESGAWQAENGRVVIRASAALEQSRFACYTTNGSEKKTIYTWEKSNGAIDGITQTPNDGAEWNINYAFSSAPQVHYTFNLEEAGRYYLYMLTSHSGPSSNSVYASIDDGELIECNSSPYGRGKWVKDTAWYFDIAAAGQHTITLYAREDGITLNQIVLSRNNNEAVTDGAMLPDSMRNNFVQHGAYIETNGKICINLSDALENSSYAYRRSGTNNSVSGVEFNWERSAGYDGMQVMPNSGAQWSTGNIAPRMSYRVDFTTPGDYYVMFYTSYRDGGSDSVFLSVDDGELISYISYIATGVGKWMANSGWKINVPTAGVHTINVYAREDGAVLHRLYLTKEASVCKNPISSPRIPIGEQQVTTQNYVYSIAENGNNELMFNNSGKYTVYLNVSSVIGASVTINGKKVEITSNANGWNKGIELDVSMAGIQKLELSASAETKINAIYAVLNEADKTGIKTLVLGDSYTSKIAWRNFDRQMAVLEAESIGIGGTKTNTWQKYADDISIYKPENLIINIGVNDIDGGISGTDCGNSIVELIKTYRAMFPKTNIFYVSICDNEMYAPGNSSNNPEKWTDYAISNGIVEDFAATADGVYFVDFAKEMKEKGPSMSVQFRDKLHLSDEAYVLFSEVIIKAVSAVQ